MTVIVKDDIRAWSGAARRPSLSQIARRGVQILIRACSVVVGCRNKSPRGRGPGSVSAPFDIYDRMRALILKLVLESGAIEFEHGILHLHQIAIIVHV